MERNKSDPRNERESYYIEMVPFQMSLTCIEILINGIVTRTYQLIDLSYSN